MSPTFNIYFYENFLNKYIIYIYIYDIWFRNEF